MLSSLQQHAIAASRHYQVYTRPEKPCLYRKRRPGIVVRAVATENLEKSSKIVTSSTASFPILVNGCTGNMGRSVAESIISAGLTLVPVSFSGREKPGGKIKVGNVDVTIHGSEEKETVLSSVINQFTELIVVDYTVPDAVNANAEIYCKLGVPFVMGTTGGDREMLYETVKSSDVYAVISPQMGKPVVAFLAAMDIMAEQFPGAFSNYHLEVMESHQASKLDTSGTAKAVVSSFRKLGVSYDVRRIRKYRDPMKQLQMIGVPEEHLGSHAFHFYCLTSPDDSVSFEFQHNVCGHKMYAEGTVDAAIFLHKKVQDKADQKLYDMIDVLREGNMR
ncbi:putative 4-hydroxy-tetrahydrodipicolinate reductase 2 [Carex littledalei]|uniref:4-hydroxy-tetrahydrodipicolinate reductase n=1 Tax=Carex littledalei TaxID=544730 RepID=A0A833QYU1_9POAL|nr:putative 4-hydroxy-tetrahydrodipicolinate reductase 2 [Carex littledalei]